MCQLSEFVLMDTSIGCILLMVAAVYVVLQVFRFIFADADFTMLWAASFGKKPGSVNVK